MRTIETTVYQFNELSDKAKDVAREWFREFALDHQWYDWIYEDAKQIGLKITGFDLDRNKHATGKFIISPHEAADLIIQNHGYSCYTFKLATNYLKDRDATIDEWEKDEDGEFVNVGEMDDKLDCLDAEFKRALLDEYADTLQKEYEHQLSNESIDENILANEYEFNEKGKRA